MKKNNKQTKKSPLVGTTNEQTSNAKPKYKKKPIPPPFIPGQYVNGVYREMPPTRSVDIDDHGFNSGGRISENVGMPNKRFFLELIKHFTLREDSQYNEYTSFIKNLDKFVPKIITVTKSDQKYELIMGLRDVNVTNEVGEYQFLGNTKYNIQSQAPTKTLHYTVTCNLYMKIYRLQGSFIERKEILNETMAAIAFDVPKLYSSMEDNGLSEHENTLLGINLDTSNYFPLGGLVYKVGWEENMIRNVFLIREPKKDEFIGDIISERPGFTMSTYLKIIYNINRHQVEITTNIPKIKQSISISLKSLFMIFGYNKPRAVAELLVSTTDHMFFLIIDRFNQMWSSSNDKHFVEQTRKANDITELFNSIRQQIKGKDKIASYNKLESTTFCEIMLDGILPHISASEFRDSSMTVVYLCRYISSMIRCSFGNCYTTDRYTYKDKVLRSTVNQVGKATQSAVDEYVRTIIKPIWSADFFSTIIDQNDKIIGERVKFLKTQMSKPIEKPKQSISNKAILQIRVGILDNKQQSKTTSSGNREVNSRIAEFKNPFRNAQSDRFVYIKGDSGNMSEHDATKRKPHPTSQHVFDLIYVPDAGRVGMIHELGGTTIISPNLLEDQLADVRESLNKFDIMPMQYVEDFMDRTVDVVVFNGLIIGYVSDGANLQKKLMQARMNQQISRYLSIKYDPQYSEIQLSTTAGSMMFCAIVLDPDTGNTKFTDFEIDGFDDVSKKSPINIDRLFGDQKLAYLHACESDSIRITTDPSNTIDFEYLVHPSMRMARSNSQHLRCSTQAEGTRVGMTTNQLRQNMGSLPEYRSWVVNKAQSQLITCESPNTVSDYAPGREEAVMNVLCALHMGGGDTNNDSSEISTEVANQCAISNRIFKMTYKTESGQVFANPNMQRQSIWQHKYDKINRQGFVAVGKLIEPDDIICVITEPSSGRIIEKTYTGIEIGRVNDSILEYNGNIGIVTISIEYTKIFTGGDKNYMPNACKSVVRVKNTNECYRTSDGRVVGMYYSSLSILKRFNFIPNICSIYQEQLDEDEDADCSERLDLGSEISTDIIEYVTKLVGDGIHLGVDYLINPVTGMPTRQKVVIFEYSTYRNIHLASEKQHIKGDQDSERRLDPVSQQSRSGKKLNGGLRAGNLGRFAMTSHGSMPVLTTQFISNSDGRSLPICLTCGTNLGSVYKNTDTPSYICKRCNSAADVAIQDTSFACNKVMTVALRGRQIAPKMIFSTNGVGNGESF